MEKPTKITLFAMISITILMAVFFVYARTNLSPEVTTQTLEECKALSYNGEGKINLLFFSTKEKAEEYSNFLLGTSPLNDYRESFNLFYIDDYHPECTLYKGIATLCHSKDLLKAAASCPNDLIIVLDDKENSIRSSSYLGVMSLVMEHPLSVFNHEFGHAFANFGEEYLTGQNPPIGSKNCVQSCSSFSESDGCFQECSKASLYRSIDSGVMRTLSTAEYGVYDSSLLVDLINKKSIGITGNQVLASPSCESQEYILFDVRTGEKSVYSGCPSSSGNGAGTYILERDQSILAEESYNPTIFTDLPEESLALTGETYDLASHEEPLLLQIPLELQADKVTVFSPEGDEIISSLLYDAGGRPCKI